MEFRCSREESTLDPTERRARFAGSETARDARTGVEGAVVNDVRVDEGQGQVRDAAEARVGENDARGLRGHHLHRPLVCMSYCLCFFPFLGGGGYNTYICVKYIYIINIYLSVRVDDGVHLLHDVQVDLVLGVAYPGLAPRHAVVGVGWVVTESVCVRD